MDHCVASVPSSLPASPMAMLCGRCHELVSQYDADSINDVNGCDVLGDLEQLDALMAQLEIRRCDLRRKINQHYSPIIQRLPHDVLSVVFNFCLPDYTKFHTSLSKIDLSAPLILGAVCKDWREIAWSSPRLWSAMAINISSSNAIFELQTCLAHEWIARSGQLPLSIRIVSKWKKGSEDSCSLFVLAALSTIVKKESSRWHTIHLSIPSKLYHIFCGPDFSAPILESLQFHSDRLQPFIPGEHKFRLLHCPRLQEIRMTMVSVRWIKVPRDSVIRTYADHLSIEDCGKILRKSPSLVHCELMDIRPSDASFNTPISTNLKYLTVQLSGTAYDGDMADFLDAITTPCLEMLTVETNEGHGVMAGDTTISGIPVSNFCSFLLRSACSLHTFSLVNARFSLQLIMDLLRVMPTLKHLTVSAPPDRGRAYETELMLEILTTIIASQGQPIPRGFLVNLETLTFIGNPRFRPGKVPQTIQTDPCQSQRPLSSVALKLYSPVHRFTEEATTFFQVVMKYGITLKVYSTRGAVENLLWPTTNLYKSSSPREVNWVKDLDLSLIGHEGVQYDVRRANLI